MIVCGLDCATTSGIAFMEGGNLIHASPFRPQGNDDATIFHGFREWLRPMLISHGVTHAAIEEPLRTDLAVKASVEDDEPEMEIGGRGKPKFAKKPIGNMRTFLRLYGLRGHAIEIFKAVNIDFVEVNNKTWRSQIYGPCSPPANVPSDKRSEWWKQKALAHCAMLKWNVKSKDAAEAALIADWRRASLNPMGRARNGDLFEGAA